MFNYQSSFWRRHSFTLAIGTCVQFVVLTIVAMLIYPGGSIADPNTRGYSFFNNFFSELGFTVTHNGQPNPVAAVLFFIALFLAGAGLALFFAAFPQFFRDTPANRNLSLAGSAFGALSGLCFIGVACTPANLYLDAHREFVLWAFRLFPVAVLCYAVAIFRTPGYPRVYGWVLVVFGALLVGYVLLLTFGPGFDTPLGVTIQATGQKTIVYASIISILIQAYGARQRAQAGALR